MTKIIIAILLLYKRYISPLLPPACRFTPTCSEYAIEAFRKKSLFRALWMSMVRVLKCHPFHPGGYDPVYPVRKPGSESGADGELTLSDSGGKIHTRPH